MAVIEFAGVRERALPRRRLRFRRFVLTTKQARAWRRLGAAFAIVLLFAGWLASIHAWHHTYNVLYGWAALAVYLTLTTIGQLLTIVPLFGFDA